MGGCALQRWVGLQLRTCPEQPGCYLPQLGAVVKTGQKFKAEMAAKIEKWQEPPPAKTVKPLPAPDAEAKKRRGGRRLRKMKERYGLTDVRACGSQSNMRHATSIKSQ